MTTKQILQGAIAMLCDSDVNARNPQLREGITDDMLIEINNHCEVLDYAG